MPKKIWNFHEFRILNRMIWQCNWISNKSFDNNLYNIHYKNNRKFLFLIQYYCGSSSFYAFLFVHSKRNEKNNEKKKNQQKMNETIEKQMKRTHMFALLRCMKIAFAIQFMTMIEHMFSLQFFSLYIPNIMFKWERMSGKETDTLRLWSWSIVNVTWNKTEEKKIIMKMQKQWITRGLSSKQTVNEGERVEMCM